MRRCRLRAGTRVPRARQIEEVAHDRDAVLGQDALRVELHAVDRQGAVRQAHDQAVAGLRRDGEVGRAIVPLDDQRVIARGLEGAVDAAKHRLAAMLDLRHLAVHRQGRARDRAAEGLPDGLQAEADAEGGDLAARRGAPDRGRCRPRWACRARARARWRPARRPERRRWSARRCGPPPRRSTSGPSRCTRFQVKLS